MHKTALITGASSGIGRELAEIHARNGHNLIITARREERLKTLKSDLEDRYDSKIVVFPADLSDENAPEEIFHFTNKHKISVDFLINNAGVGDYGFFHEADWSRQRTMLDLNIKSLTHLTHLYLPEMIKKERAYIMNVASTAAFQPGPLMSVYYASKHYVLAFSEGLANELSNTGVTVTALCPGPTKSEFQEQAKMEKSKMLDRLPIDSSKDVAEYGYKAMMNGKRVAVYGFLNKIMANIVGLFPRNFVTLVVRKIQERK